LKEGLLNNFKS